MSFSFLRFFLFKERKYLEFLDLIGIQFFTCLAIPIVFHEFVNVSSFHLFTYWFRVESETKMLGSGPIMGGR